MAYRGKDKKQPYKPATKVKPPARGRGYRGTPTQPMYDERAAAVAEQQAAQQEIYNAPIGPPLTPAYQNVLNQWYAGANPYYEAVTPVYQNMLAAIARSANAPPYIATRGGRRNPYSSGAGLVGPINSRGWQREQQTNRVYAGFKGAAAPQPQRKQKPQQFVPKQSGETYGVLPWNPGTYPEQEYAGGGYGGYGGYGGGGGYEYTPTQYPFKEYQQSYAMQGVPAPAAPTMRTTAQAQPYRGYANANEAQRWIQYLINWRV